MNVIKLKKYGINLSGRGHGMNTYLMIINEHEGPYELDFEGVFSIGSSFADEVVAKLAKASNNKIMILNSTNVINKCLKDVAKDKGFNLLYK